MAGVAPVRQGPQPPREGMCSALLGVFKQRLVALYGPREIACTARETGAGVREEEQTGSRLGLFRLGSLPTPRSWDPQYHGSKTTLPRGRVVQAPVCVEHQGSKSQERGLWHQTDAVLNPNSAISSFDNFVYF